MTFCFSKRDLSFFAFRLAAKRGLSTGELLAFMFPGPGSRIAAQDARPALDLDEEEPTSVSTKRSTSLMLPSSAMNWKLDQARKGSFGGNR